MLFLRTLQWLPIALRRKLKPFVIFLLACFSDSSPFAPSFGSWAQIVPPPTRSAYIAPPTPGPPTTLSCSVLLKALISI